MEEFILSTCNYVVEQLEHGHWEPKCRTNFEDPKFVEIAKNPSNRILCNGVDVTDRYRAGHTNVSVVNTPQEAPMKPAAYKALSQDEKLRLQQQALQLRDNKKKRVEILSLLNISEATYDTMRADMANTTPTPSSSSSDVAVSTPAQEQPIPTPVSTSPNTVKRAGLLGRR